MRYVIYIWNNCVWPTLEMAQDAGRFEKLQFNSKKEFEAAKQVIDAISLFGCPEFNIEDRTK